MFSSNSRSHQRPYGWGLSSSGGVNGSPPPQTLLTGNGTSNASSNAAAGVNNSNNTNTSGNAPLSGGIVVGRSNTISAGTLGSSSAIPASSLIRPSSATSPNMTAAQTPSMATSSSSAAGGGGKGLAAGGVVGVNAGIVGGSLVGAGQRSMSAGSNSNATIASSNTLIGGGSSLLPSGSALNATRATHNSSTAAGVTSGTSSSSAAPSASSSSSYFPSAALAAAGPGSALNTSGGGGGAGGFGIGGVTATGSISNSSSNPYAPFITSNGGNGGGTSSAANSNPNSARNANNSYTSYHSAGVGGGTSNTNTNECDYDHGQARYSATNDSVNGKRGGGGGAAIIEEEDYSRAQLTPSVAALRANNIVSPSGMTSEQTQRLVALLGASTVATTQLLAPTSTAASSPHHQLQKVTSKTFSSSSSTNIAFIDDDRASLQKQWLNNAPNSSSNAATTTSSRSGGGSSSGQLVIGEVQTKLRLFDLFHYWSTQPDTQAVLKSLTDEALKGLSTATSGNGGDAGAAGGGAKISPRAYVGITGAAIPTHTSGGGNPTNTSNSNGSHSSSQKLILDEANTDGGGGGGGGNTTSSKQRVSGDENNTQIPSIVPPLKSLAAGSNTNNTAAQPQNDPLTIQSGRTPSPAVGGKSVNNNNNSSPRDDSSAASSSALPLLMTQREEKVEAVAGEGEEDASLNNGRGGGGGDDCLNGLAAAAGEVEVGSDGEGATAGIAEQEQAASSPLAMGGGGFSPLRNVGAMDAPPLPATTGEMSIDITPPRESSVNNNFNTDASSAADGPIPSTHSPTAGDKNNNSSSGNAAINTSTGSSTHRHAKSPRSGHIALPCPPSSSLDGGSMARAGRGGGAAGGSEGSSGGLLGGFHIVDEVDAAHARGGLSPRVGSLAATINAMKKSGGGALGAEGSEPFLSLQSSNSFRNAANAAAVVSAGSVDEKGAFTPHPRSGAGTPNRPRSPADGTTPLRSPHHSGASTMLLDSNQVRPPSPLNKDLDRASVSGGRVGRSPSPVLNRDSRESSSSDSKDSKSAATASTAAAAGATPLARTNSGTGQRPNIPKASTPRGQNGSRAHSPAPATADVDKDDAKGGKAAAKKKQYATYDDIPRFYFGDGKPDSGRSATIAAPHYRYHVNPHLRSFDGIAIPPAQLEQIKAAAAAAEAEKKAAEKGSGGASSSSPAGKGKGKKNAVLADDSPTKAANSKQSANSESTFSLSTLDPAAFAGLNIPQPGYRLAPMMALTVMEDEDVNGFIAKEFSKVPVYPGPAPAPIMSPPSATRSVSASGGAKTVAGRGGGVGGKRPMGAGGAAAAANNTPTNASAIAAHAKLEAAYRAALYTAMTNIVTNAYGLPKYFTPMVMKKLIYENMQQQQQQQSNAVTSSLEGGALSATPTAAAAGKGPKKDSNAAANKASDPSSSSASSSLVPCVEGVPQGMITVAQAKAFYEKHMRFTAPIRRFFNAFVVCNLNNNNNNNTNANSGNNAANANAGTSASSQEGLGGGEATPQPQAPLPAGGAGGGGEHFAAALFGTDNPNSDNGSNSITNANNASTSEEGGGAGGNSSSNSARRNYLIREDFIPYLDALLELHPGLSFLRQTADFQAKYVETIFVRIFFECDVHDRGRISWPEFERSKLPDAIRQVEVAEDINSVLNFFSYEHFYVIYCRFWELDSDRDMLIDANDLANYFQEGTANSKVIERIFQGHGRKLLAPPVPAPPAPAAGGKGKSGSMTLAAKRAAAAAAAADPAGIANKRMGYEDFVWFCLAEEDKASPRSIRYWFRILDLDADGVICGWELEQFYNCTKDAMIAVTSECISFEDIMCQIVDMVPALSEGHSALDRSFDRQRLVGGAALSGHGSNSIVAPLRTVSLSDKVRRRSSLTAGPLALPSAASPPMLPPPPSMPLAGSPPLPGKDGKSSAASLSLSAGKAPTLSNLNAISPIVEDPRLRYHRYGLTLRDLLASPSSAHVALNMVLNVVKFLTFEQKDPFVSHHDRLLGGYEGTEWDRFARGEYDRMASEADE